MKLFTYIITVLFASAVMSFAGPDKDKVVEREKNAWQTYKDQKPEMRKLLSDNYHATYQDGFYNVDKEMQAMKGTDIQSFVLSDFDVAATDADTVIVNYNLALQAISNKGSLSGDYHCTSIWQKHNDTWQVSFHTGVLVGTPPQPPT
jgi:hypothetical protein